MCSDTFISLAGRLQPDPGGGTVAHNTSPAELRNRMNDDPFVAGHIVSVEVPDMATVINR